jgi:lipopolysaccharide biosynthesis protein
MKPELSWSVRRQDAAAKALDLLRQRQYWKLIHKVLGKLQAKWQEMWRITWGALDYEWARFQSTEDFVVQVWPGDQELSNNGQFRLVLFAHHDSGPRIAEYVVYQLSCLARLPATIVFVSTAPHLSEESIARIRSFCHTIVLRKNIGWDFGSWKMAMDLCPLLIDRARTLILMNDSCYGPFCSLDQIVHTLESKDNCLSGITACHEIDYHIQSYFMLFPEGVLKSPYFADFRNGLRYLQSKWSVIIRFEVGTSVLARKHGIELYPWVQEGELQKTGAQLSQLKRNLTIWDWEMLLLENFSPFLKKSLFGESRQFLGDREHLVWDYVRERTDYPPSLIENHLIRQGIPVSRGLEKETSGRRDVV